MTKQTHRHLVAVPIALLMVLTFVFLASVIPVRAELRDTMQSVYISATKDDEEFYVGEHVSGVMKAGSVISSDTTGMRMFLHSGQALVRSSGFMTFVSGDVALSVLQGSFVAVRDFDSIMIAALDSPLIVTSGTSSIVLAPRMQVLFQKYAPYAISSVGSEWLSSQMHELRLLRSSVVPQMSEEVIKKECSFEGNVLAETSGVLQALLASGRVTEEVYDCIFRLSNRIDNARMLRRLSLLTLAAEGARTEDKVSSAILEEYIHDPILRSSLVEVLPAVALVGHRVIQSSLINYFSTVIIEKGLADPDAAILSLEKAASVPLILKNRGLPLQADAWHLAIVDAITVLKSALSLEHRMALEKLLHQGSMLSSDRSAEVVIPQASGSTTHWTSDELLFITRNALVEYGALFANSTVILPDTDLQTVSVEGIYVLEDDRNVLYAFTFDPARNVLMHIIREGKRLPNVVPIGTFFTQ